MSRQVSHYLRNQLLYRQQIAPILALR